MFTVVFTSDMKISLSVLASPGLVLVTPTGALVCSDYS
ncbi:hypothetical protein AcetOrient_orf00033p (plasmid) [Acetobacter orientalis]|uniref:Uncharacterized protein n=1 Tax=Acetobacter orientalis TaxID=146474 RepID=A0A2Z5ZMN8_9PROT|nr:hypothetical protein AcetOrient_orf00033p [Acetobacter orientalis]